MTKMEGTKCQGRDTDTETGGYRGDIRAKTWENSIPDRESSRAEGKWLRSGLRDRESPDHAEPEGMILYFEFSLQSVLFKPLSTVVSLIRSKYLSGIELIRS